MREVLLLHHECFQACVCQSQFSGVCQDVISGAGGLHHFADAGQSDRRRGAVSAGPGTEWQYADYVGDGRHVAAFCLFSFLCLFRIAGRQFHSDAGYGRVVGTDCRSGRSEVRCHRARECQLYHACFHVGFSGGRGPYTAHGHCADYGDYGTFRSLLSFGGCWRVDLLFYGTSANEAFQRLPL